MTHSPLIPPSYPARPINGGPLDKALPKTGAWLYEPKYNGWRALIHVPTGAMFNRQLQPLTIQSEFKDALNHLKKDWASSPLQERGCEWLDCEALERRHNLGKGTLFILDALIPQVQMTNGDVAGYPYASGEASRRKYIIETYGGPLEVFRHGPRGDGRTIGFVQPADNFVHVPKAFDNPDEIWPLLQQANQEFGCDFYEGVVAKRADSLYPIQLRSAKAETPCWIKHRWSW